MVGRFYSGGKEIKMLPVFIHHETGEKPQTGGEKNQGFIKDCIRQAEKYNERVILLGDKYNKSWCANWYDERNFAGEKWKNFEDVFVNLSTYPDAWALGIFRRFFCLEEFMIKNDIREAVLLDSDVLVYCDFSKYFAQKDCDAAISMIENQDMEILPKGNGMRWVASGHTSFWKIGALQDFTSFCIDTYKNNLELLEKKWGIHKEKNLPGGVCEMTLIYLWQKDNKEYVICNTAPINAGCVINYNMVTGTNYRDNEYKTYKIFNMIKVYYRGGYPYFCTKENEYIKALTLHFSGKYKIFIHSLYSKQRIDLRSTMEFLYWLICGKLSKLKHKFWG